jgi:hypothetical protein
MTYVQGEIWYDHTIPCILFPNSVKYSIQCNGLSNIKQVILNESGQQLMSAIEKCAENTGNLIKMTDSSKPSDYFFDYVKACAWQLATQAIVDELTEGVFQGTAEGQ